MRDSSQSFEREPPRRLAGVSEIDEAAEAWLRRVQRGLSLDEELEFADWLAADARHEISLKKYQAAWDRFAPLAGTAATDQALSPDRFAAADSDASHGMRPPRGESSTQSRLAFARWAAAVLGLAAAVALLFTLAPRWHAPPRGTPVLLPALCEQRTLADGSVVQLNRGARVSVNFSAAERRVRLEHGEAIFTVTKDPARPFIVAAGALDVRAIGTVFNVRFDPGAVEVVVTEGKVQLADGVVRRVGPVPPPTPAPANSTLVVAGQKALVALTPLAPPPEVTTLAPEELEERLAWQPRMLDFDDAPLSAIVAEFNRRNPVRLVIDDPIVANRRMTASFRSDNLDAFVRLLEANIGVEARHVSATEIALSRK